MGSVGEYLVKSAHRRGVILIVDWDRRVRYFPNENVSQAFITVIDKYHRQIREWILADAVSGGD